MIAVKVSGEEISIDGHAEYAEPGKDIICSAVTALSFNLIYSMEALTEDAIECDAEDPGHINIKFKDLSERGKLLVDSFFIGLCSIAEEFPEYIRIE